MTKEQICKVLIDDNTEMLISSSSPLKLKEGYELGLIYVNASQSIVQLKKNNISIDTKIIQPSIAGASMDDKTYYYRTSIGNVADIVTIAVHFKNSIHGPDKDFATVNGIFQISDTPIILTNDQQYGKMSIRNVNPTDYTITLDNKDNQITLAKNKDIPFMGAIHIKTADQDYIDIYAPLRYYIYAEETNEYG
jgi:S-layer protein (TIGR01567 family)